MLNNTQLQMIKLCKSAIKQIKEQGFADFSLENCKDIIKRNNLFNIIHFGCKTCDIKEPKWNSDMFLLNSMHLSMLWENAETLMIEFDKQNISCISLKGVVSKDKYPDKYMRVMSDVDILVDPKQYKKLIKPIMIKQGFTEGTESDHEYVWHKDKITIELHKRLIPSYDEDFYKVIGKNDFEWYKNDNEFTYNFIHFAKHYRDAGIGITHLIDLEVNWKDNQEEKLKPFHLDIFYKNIKSVLDYWFRDKEPNERDLFITEKIFNSGSYGTKDNFNKSQSIKKVNFEDGNVKKARWKDFWKRAFPPYAWMKVKYPFLKKICFLLPIMWVYRWFAVLFSGGAKEQININQNISNNNSDYKNELEYVGLDFYK